MSDLGDTSFEDHEDDPQYPNDPNAPHGVNTEEEKLNGLDDESA